MKTILFTNARDEDNIVEWIAHHLNLGFTTIYLYDHKSKIPIQELLISTTNTNDDHPRNKVILDRIEEDMPHMKINLLNKSLEYAKQHQYDWMLYLDADEFLYFKKAMNVNDFLKDYLQYNEVTISWLMFGSNFISNKPRGTILESYTKSCNHFNNTVHPKSICKPFIKVSTAIKYHNAHYVVTNNKQLEVHSTFNKLTPVKPWLFFPTESVFEISTFIAHHVHQCYETYTSRKVNLPTDNTNTFRPRRSEQYIHSIFNDIDNYTLRDKYNERNKETMKTVGNPEYLRPFL